MKKDEFLMRFSKVKGKKSKQFKNLITPLTDDINEDHFLHELKFSTQQIQEFKQAEVNYLLDWLDKKNHSLICFHDENYPNLLKQISNPPLILFIKGSSQLLNSAQLAMVGSRQFSEYGAQWARYFASELAVCGLTITSGLALGIDAICHRGALEVYGKTIAVLGSGIDNLSPKTNTFLANEIIEKGGVIVSEFYPNQQAMAEFFPRRNRIISGLSLGTFVIEANEKSGSLITAKYALEQNRDVFAMPGEINSDYSNGTHYLIKQGAHLVSHPNDILEHYNNSLAWIKNQKNDNQNDDIIHPELFTLINNKAVSIDFLAEKTSQSVSDVAIKLLDLELAGLIKTVLGGYMRQKLI